MLTGGTIFSRRGESRHLLLGLVALVGGCACPQPRHVRQIFGDAKVGVLERSRLQHLRLVEVRHECGMGGTTTWIAEEVPLKGDNAALRRLLNENRPYRRRTDLLQTLGRVGRSEQLPTQWPSLLCWIIGTDPLIIGVGGRQGEHVPRHGESRYPLVGPADVDAPVHHLIIFEDGTWPALSKAKRASDIERIPHRVVLLPNPLSLGQILSGVAGEYIRTGQNQLTR